MPIANSREYALLGKAEATPDVDAAPTPALNAIRLATRPSFTPDFGENEDKSIAQAFGDGKSMLYGKGLKLDVEFYMRSGGGLGVVPDWAAIIECAGHNVVPTANAKVTIDPVTATGTSRKTSTFYYYEDGLLWKFVGAMATFTFDAPIDGEVRGKASITAPYAAPVETALPAGLAYQTSDFIKVAPTDVVTDSGTVSVGSYAFESSASIVQRRLIGADQVHMEDRPKPMVTLSKASLGTVADFNRLVNSTTAALHSVFGSAGNRITFDAPQGQYVSIKPTADGIHMNREVGIALRGRDAAYQIVID